MKIMETVGISIGVFLVLAFIATLTTIYPAGHWGDVNPAIAIVCVLIMLFAIIILALKRL